MKQIPVILTEDQIGTLVEILSKQASVQGTASMRAVVSIEDTLIKAQKASEEEADTDQK